MKIIYEAPPAPREAAAYIDCEGCLIMKPTYDTDDRDVVVDLSENGARIFSFRFSPEDPTNQRVLYAGDSVTLSF